MESLELLETFADEVDVLLDPWDGTCGWPDGLIGPLGSKMLMILDNFADATFFL